MFESTPPGWLRPGAFFLQRLKAGAGLLETDNDCFNGVVWYPFLPQAFRLAGRASIIKRMKIYIVTDLEGPAGVNRWIQTREGETPESAVKEI